MRRLLLALALIALLLGFAPTSAFAQYPTKPIRFIVPWGPGSGPDVTSRIVATELSARLGQPIVIDNRPGAGGTVGMALIARAAPDGYTVGPGNIGRTLVSANVLAVRLSLPVKSVQELIVYAKNNPGKLLYGSPGNGTSPHVGMELFKLMTGAQMVHVPYKDAQQAITGLVAGQVDLLFDNMPAIVPHVRAGRVRGLAVTGPKRSPAVPELPTVAEAGVTGFEVITWAGVIGPRGIPKDIVARLNAEINSALMSPALKEKFAGLGLEPAGGTPEEFDTFMKKEAAKWADVVKRAGVRVD